MYIGLDVGTSSVKAVLYSEEGKVLEKASKSYSVYGEKEHLELDPLEVKKAAFSVLKKMGESRRKIKAIGVSSLGEAAVLLDKSGNVITSAILPGDRRGTEEAKMLQEKDWIISRTGLPVNGTYTACKLLWIKNHRPEIYSKVRRVMLFGDYIIWCLTGERRIGHSLASRTMAYDLKEKTFFESAEGIDPEWFSEPADADECVGQLKPEVAGELCMKKDVLVFAGGHDQPCAALGTGAIKEGWASDSIGTSECITTNLGDFRLEDETIRSTNFACEPFLEAGTYNTMAYTHTAGKLVEWLYGNIAGRKPDTSVKKDKAVPTGLLVLPHFAGSGTPYMDATSTGAIVGLTLHTDLELLYRGILENICYEMRQNLQLLKEHKIVCNKMIAVGGGTKSELWLQYKANIYQMPVYTTECGEASALGAAITAAKGVGDFKTWNEAVEAMVRTKYIYEPDTKFSEQFEEAYEKYSRMYHAVKNIY